MKNLTLRYSVTQFTYWAASSGAVSFAAAYLLSKGLSPGRVGTVLASAGLLSCLTQPVLASAADKAKGFVLTKMLLALSALCCLCFSALLFPHFPLALTSVFYMTGIWCADAMVPLLNALSVACRQAGYAINYGASRGIGSVATAVSSLALGFVIARLGTAWMLLFLLGFRVLCMTVIAGYPTLQKESTDARGTKESCSIPYFFSHYRWYCLSLMGILFLGMYHSMTENYLIAILGALGGDSSHVGKALFLSAVVGTPVIFFYDQIHTRIRDACLLKIAAVSFLVKALLFTFAKSIAAVYFLQLLQTTSYALLAPAQVSYANEKVRRCDMVKGQSFITAAYALGCSAGNFAGGLLLGYGVRAILLSGIFMTFMGTVFIFTTVNRSDQAQ